MKKPKILVTSAAGKTGFPTVLQLLEKDYPVRAFVHCADHRSEMLRSRGAEIFVGSLEDIVDVRRGLQGVQRAYFCAPLLRGCLSKSTVFAAAAQEHKLEVAGQTPEDFETIVRRYVAVSPFVKRTLGSRARAIVNLTKAMLTPAPNLEKYARAHSFPRLPHASFALESATWRDTHESGDHYGAPATVEGQRGFTARTQPATSS